MKPIHLNLASRPYRDYRPLYATVVAMSLAIAFLMLNNIDTYYRYVRETKTTRAEIAQLDAEAMRERERARATESQLRGVNVAALNRQTRFINAQLAERAFSWSELLERLEEVLPSDVRITSITPRFGDAGGVHLDLQLEAKTGQGMIEILNRFTRHSQFRNPFPRSETAQNDRYLFSVTVEYQPTAARVVTLR